MINHDSHDYPFSKSATVQIALLLVSRIEVNSLRDRRIDSLVSGIQVPGTNCPD